MNLLPFTASATIPENESYEINGLNIWDWEWRTTGQRTLMNNNGKLLSLNVYEISNGQQVAHFIAYEVSNNVWRIDHPYSV